MMNVVVDNVAFTIQKIGGISVVWYEIIKRLLRDQSIDVKFVECPDAKDNYYRKQLDIDNKVISKIRKSWFKIIRYINPRLGIKHPYIFHSTYYRVSRDRTAINFTTVHDFVYERGGGKSLRSRLHMWQQKQAVMKSDAVICISENTKRDLLYYYKNIDPSRVHVVYNGVSEEYNMVNLDSIKLPFDYKKYCIYVGVRRKYKNYELVVESISKTDYKLVIIGAQLNQIETEYLDLTLGKGNYICISNVSNKRLNELYNGAFALMYLSTYEGFGIPCLEAQKAGCPVVACNSSSIPEVVCDKRLLIEKQNVSEVISKLKKLEDKAYYEQIVQKGVVFANKFSWDRTYEQLYNLYRLYLNKSEKQ